MAVTCSLQVTLFSALLTSLKNWLNVYVVVSFLSQVIFVFLLFLGMVMYANEVETKEKQKLPEIKKKLTTTYIYIYVEDIIYKAG